MPYPRYQKRRRQTYHPNMPHHQLEFAEELTEKHMEFKEMQPVPQPKDYDEIEY